MLKGTDPTLPVEFRLRELFRFDVERVSDAKIVDAVARLIAAYVRSLEFETDEAGAFVGSPFDRFLEVNGLPRFLRDGETAENYSKRLRGSLKKLRNPRFVADGPFALHNQQRNFGASELAGLLIFLTEPPKQGVGPSELLQGGIGNCVTCHPAPLFTDFRLHNTGVSQLDYDAVHGDGSFFALAVPDLATRSLDPEEWLPATAQHPNAREPFRAIPSGADPGLADLGAWNVFANADFPEPQARLSRALCFELKPAAAALRSCCSHAQSRPPRRPGCATSRIRRRTCTTAAPTRWRMSSRSTVASPTSRARASCATALRRSPGSRSLSKTWPRSRRSCAH